jgi:hypothetical protein
MIAVLTVMSDMDLSHDYLGFLVGISSWDLWFGLDLVDLAMVCSRCEAWVHVWLQVGCL